MKRVGKDIVEIGASDSTDNKQLLFDDGAANLSGFRKNVANGVMEYSDNGTAWFPLGAFFPRVFTQERSVDTADEHYYQGYQSFLGVSLSDAIETLEFKAALDDGNFNYTAKMDLAGLTNWFNSNILSNRFSGTKSIIQAIVTYKSGRENELAIARLYSNEAA